MPISERGWPISPISRAGDAVTETVAAGGRNAAWARAFFSGTSSNVGALSAWARASRAAADSAEWRRKSVTSHVRVGDRGLAAGGGEPPRPPPPRGAGGGG